MTQLIYNGEVGRKMIGKLEVIAAEESLFDRHIDKGFLYVFAFLSNVVAQVKIPAPLWDNEDFLQGMVKRQLEEILGEQLYIHHYNQLP